MESSDGANQLEGKAPEIDSPKPPKMIARTCAKRKENIKKKTMELSTLCDIKACAIMIGTDGQIDTWPENKDEVKEMIDQYRHCDARPKQKPNLETAGKEQVEAVKIAKIASYRRKVDMLSLIESKLAAVDQRLESLRAQKNRGIGTAAERIFDESVAGFYKPLSNGGLRMKQIQEIDFMGVGDRNDGKIGEEYDELPESEPLFVEPLQSVPWSGYDSCCEFTLKL